MVSKLLPFKTSESKYAVNETMLESLIRPENLDDYKTIRKDDLPRISGLIMSGYSNAFLTLGNIYKESGEPNEAKSLIKTFEEYMKVDFDADFETLILNELKK